MTTGEAYTGLYPKKTARNLAVYTAHLDYRNCAYYDVRGYDGNTWEKEEPVTNIDSILILNKASVRDDAIANFLAEAQKTVKPAASLSWAVTSTNLRTSIGQKRRKTCSTTTELSSPGTAP